jgi:hypothetical protein
MLIFSNLLSQRHDSSYEDREGPGMNSAKFLGPLQSPYM